MLIMFDKISGSNAWTSNELRRSFARCVIPLIRLVWLVVSKVAVVEEVEVAIVVEFVGGVEVMEGAGRAAED